MSIRQIPEEEEFDENFPKLTLTVSWKITTDLDEISIVGHTTNPWSPPIKVKVAFPLEAPMNIDAYLSLNHENEFTIQMDVFKPSFRLKFPGFFINLSPAGMRSSRSTYELRFKDTHILLKQVGYMSGSIIISIKLDIPEAEMDYFITLNLGPKRTGIQISEDGNLKLLITLDHKHSENYWNHDLKVRLPIEGFEDTFRLSITSGISLLENIKEDLSYEEKSTNLIFSCYPGSEDMYVMMYNYINIDPDRKNETLSEKIIKLELSNGSSDEDSGPAISFTMNEGSQRIVSMSMSSNQTSAGRDISMDLVSPYSIPLHLDASYKYHSYDDFLADVSLKWENTYQEPQHIKLDVKMNSNAGSPCLKADLATTLEDDFPAGNLFLQYDFNDARKNATAKYSWNQETSTATVIEFFAESPEGFILKSGITIRKDSYAKDNFEYGDILARSDFSDIELKVAIKEDTDKMLLSAELTSPIKDWEFVAMEGSLEHNKVLKPPVSLLFCNRKKVRSNLHHL